MKEIGVLSRVTKRKRKKILASKTDRHNLSTISSIVLPMRAEFQYTCSYQLLNSTNKSFTFTSKRLSH